MTQYDPTDGMRFDASEIGGASTEIAAHGTPVLIAPRPPA